MGKVGDNLLWRGKKDIILLEGAHIEYSIRHGQRRKARRYLLHITSGRTAEKTTPLTFPLLLAYFS
jgi:hypothetical protein